MLARGNAPAAARRWTDNLKIPYVLFFLLSAFAGVLLFSETTSPLYSDVGYDSAMFQTIGKYWAQGHLPYVELFDHKGPLIFLINAAGYALCGRSGVFLLQVLFLAVSEFLAWQLLREYAAPAFALAAALLMPVVLAANWQEGNTTEEYLLPLLFACYAHMLRWWARPAGAPCEHPPRAAFVYGLCFAFALLTRVTNALGVCVGVGYISILLICKGRWRNLAWNAALFLAGVAVLVVPFCVYFAAHGALYEMWYGTLLFNLDYAAASGTAAPLGLTALAVLFRRYLMGWCLVGVSLLALFLRRDGRAAQLFWLCISLASTLFLYTLNDYAHYGICLLPLLYVAVCLLVRLPKAAARRTDHRRALLLGMSLLVLASAGLKIYKSKTEVLPPQAYERYGDDYTPLLSLIPPEGRESFVAFDCPRRLYLESGLRPAFRFFTLQQWMSVNSPAFAETIHTEFARSRTEWVLTFHLYTVPLVTSDILEADYRCVAQSENGIYRLYHLTAAEND